MTRYLELKEQIEQLSAQAEALRKSELAAAIVEIKTKMAVYGITLMDLRQAGVDEGKPATAAVKTTTPPKYKGPNGELWSGGRGRKPDWVLKVIKERGEAALEGYLIKRDIFK